MKRDVTRKVLEALDGFEAAMLVTHTQDDDLRARPMALAQHREPERVALAFVSPKQAPKISEIQNDAHVNVCLQREGRFISFSGRVRLVDDADRLDAVWSDDLARYLPGGARREDLTLLEVVPEQGELWDGWGSERLRFLLEDGRAYLVDEELAPARSGR